MEKRKFSRVPFHIQAEVEAEGLAFTGEVQNISLKGMFVLTEHNLDLGSLLHVKICLMGSQSDLSIELKGKAVRQTPDGIGIYFETIDLDSFIHLKNIVDYNSADPEKVMQEFLEFGRAKGQDKN